MSILAWFLPAVLWLIVPLWAIVRVVSMRREIQHLRRRIEALELGVTREPASATSHPRGEESAPASPPEPMHVPPSAEPVAGPSPPATAPAALASPTAGGAPRAPTGPAEVVLPSRASVTSFEQRFGGVWLQNIGAVLLLLGIFFMILWGYATGRLGPEAIVGAGVAVGLTFAWRGDRMAHDLPALGHTFIGIGLGVVYLSLYLGHFTLRVLPPWLAFGLLTLVSFASIVTGLRYRAPAIAALGVIGAFVPQLMAAWIPLKGFSMTPPALVAYLAVVNVVVFALAARPGWSGLNLASLLLGAFTWTATFAEPRWGWGTEVALAALFALLGLAPVPRLARTGCLVPRLDLAVVALAPLCMIAASWPMLATSDRTWVAILLFVLAAVYLLAALWVDGRRPEQDLWRPLTGAATLFLAAALQRAVGSENTPMAWCAEGALLVALGLSARGGWLRFCGYMVTTLGAAWTVGALFFASWDHGALPALYPAGIRDLVCLATVLVGARALGRGRAHLSPGERFVPEVWTGAGNLMMMLWAAREANHLAYALEGSGGRWQRQPAVTAPAGSVRRESLAYALVGAAWLAQSSALLLMTVRPGRGFVRICGYVAAGLAGFSALLGLASADGWSNDLPPVFYPAGLLNLACVVALAVVAERLSRRRPALAKEERRMPEVWTVGASMLMLAWTAREADHLARALEAVPGAFGRFPGGRDPVLMERVRTLAAAFTSAAWLAQAIVLLVLGWARDSSFLRWTGLVLFGLTVLKLVLYDLQTVDAFWRFLTAVIVGAALLAVSYAYQRRNRAAVGR